MRRSRRYSKTVVAVFVAAHLAVAVWLVWLQLRLANPPDQALTVLVPDTLAAGGRTALRVIVHHRESLAPVVDARLAVRLGDATWRGVTDLTGSAEIALQVPELDVPRHLSIVARSALGTSRALLPVQVRARRDGLIVPARTHWQPGETILVHGLVSDAATRRAAAGEDVVLRFVEPLGRLVDERTVRADAVGQFATTLPLAARAPTGVWHVELWHGGDRLDRRALGVGPPAPRAAATPTPPARLGELRLDQAVYRVGDAAQVTILSPPDVAAVYLAVERDGQTLAVRSAVPRNGQCGGSLRLERAFAGSLVFRALARSGRSGWHHWTARAVVVPEALPAALVPGHLPCRPGEHVRLRASATPAAGWFVTAPEAGAPAPRPLAELCLPAELRGADARLTELIDTARTRRLNRDEQREVAARLSAAPVASARPRVLSGQADVPLAVAAEAVQGWLLAVLAAEGAAALLWLALIAATRGRADLRQRPPVVVLLVAGAVWVTLAPPPTRRPQPIPRAAPPRLPPAAPTAPPILTATAPSSAGRAPLLLVATDAAGRVGSASASLLVVEPLAVRLTTPSPLTVGARGWVTARVTNNLGRPTRVAVRIVVPAPLVDLRTPQTATLPLEAGASAELKFQMVGQRPGTGVVELLARAGRELTRRQAGLRVVTDGRWRSGALGGLLLEETPLSIWLPAETRPYTRRLELRLETSWPGLARSAAEGLERRPPCAEQAASALWAWTLADDPGDHDLLAYQALLAQQRRDGGFGGAAETAWCLLAMRAAALGRSVDRELIRNAALRLAASQSHDGSWRELGGSIIQASALASWAVAKVSEAGSASARGTAYLAARDDAGDPADLAWRAVALLHAAPGSAAARHAVRDAAACDVSTATTETAAALAYALEVSGARPDLAAALTSRLLAERSPDGAWPTARGTILALHALRGAVTTRSGGRVDVELNGQVVRRVTLTNPAEVVDLTEWFRRGTNRLTLRPTGGARPIYLLAWRYAAP